MFAYFMLTDDFIFIFVSKDNTSCQPFSFLFSSAFCFMFYHFTHGTRKIIYVAVPKLLYGNLDLSCFPLEDLILLSVKYEVVKGAWGC